jgi:hypothetical protein
VCVDVYLAVGLCVWVYACVCVCVWVCARARTCACVSAYGGNGASVHTWDDAWTSKGTQGVCGLTLNTSDFGLGTGVSIGVAESG